MSYMHDDDSSCDEAYEDPWDDKIMIDSLDFSHYNENDEEEYDHDHDSGSEIESDEDRFEELNPEEPLDMVVFTKQASSEEDYLFCFTYTPYMSSTKYKYFEEFHVRVEDLSRTLSFHGSMCTLIVQNQLLLMGGSEFVCFNSPSPNTTVKILFANISKQIKTTAKFTSADQVKGIIGLTAQDGYYLLITKDKFQRNLQNDEEKIKQFSILEHKEEFLVKIDHHKFFNGEQVSKLHKASKGLIFQTTANSFYLLGGTDLFKNWYQTEETGSATVSSPFHKLKIPKNAQALCTRKSILVYAAEGFLYLSNQLKNPVRLEVRGSCKYLDIVHEVLICLTSNGSCYFFEIESHKLLMMVDAQEFGDKLTEVHYIYKPIGRDYNFDVGRLVFFSESTQQLYVLEGSSNPRLKQIQLRQLVRKKKYFVREGQQPGGDFDEDESEEEAQYAAEQELKNKPILDHYDRKLKEGWRIKTIRSNRESLIFVYHKYHRNYFTNRSMESNLMSLTDVTVTTR